MTRRSQRSSSSSTLTPGDASSAINCLPGKGRLNTPKRFATRLRIDLTAEQHREEKPMNTRYQFRLNGMIITDLKVRPVVIAGATDKWELVACHKTLGELAIEVNDGLADPALTQFV